MQDFLDMGGYAFYVWSSFGFGFSGVMYLYFSAKSSAIKKQQEVKTWLYKEEKKK